MASSYTGRRSSYPTVDPRVYQQAQQAIIDAQKAKEIAVAQERGRAAQAEREFKAEQEIARQKAQMAANIAKQSAAASLLTTQTNSAWNLAKAKQDAEKNKKTVTRKMIGPDQSEITYHLTPEENAALDAKLDAEKKAPEIKKLTAERQALADEIDKKGWKGWGLSDRRNTLKKLDDQLKELQPPANLLGSTDIVNPTAPVAPVAPIAPTPRGFIGGPGKNTFLDLSNPEIAKATEGMNREQTNAYAINRNNQGAATTAPADLLRSDSFPLGYNPAHGSFQMQPDPQTERGVPVEQPVASPNILGAPVPQDAPIADFNPGPQDVSTTGIPAPHVQHLIANPKLSDFFDKKYGAGAAAKVLQDTMAKDESQP